MLILSIDSSQPVGSVTLARSDEYGYKLIDTLQATGAKFSAQLIPTVKRLLEAHNIEKHHIDVIAAASGPGTFTGLRVGLAAVKALAETLQKPVVTVSVLQAVSFYDHDPTLAIVEAGKGFWYVGLYSPDEREEHHFNLEQMLAFVAQHPGTRVRSLGSLPAELKDGATQVDYAVSEIVARIAAGKATRKEFTAIDALDANYVRPDEALYKTS